MRWQGTQSNAFFEVELDGQNDIIEPQDVLSLTITEEIERMPQGSLILRDPNILYSRVIPRGARINISWGYTVGGGTAFDAERPDRIARGLERRGMRAWVTNPNGAASDDGTISYNLSFVGLDFRGEEHVTQWTEQTKADVVRAVLSRLGISRFEVAFDRGSEAVTDTAPVRQAETDFAFLARLAREWRAVLIVGHTQRGEPAAVFVEPRRVTGSALVAEMAGRRTTAVGLEYKVGREPNVLNYTWRHHEGESGVGDAVSLEYINGEAVYVRRTIEADRIITWRLDQERIDAELNARRDRGGIASEAALVQEVVSARSFEEVKRFFYPTESETAPNGIGYSIQARIFGDTTAFPGTKIQIGQGFPDMFREQNGRPVDFYIRKNTHQIGNGGYFCDLDVVDAYTLSPTGVVAIGGGAL
jgi:hypothetical protein